MKVISSIFRSSITLLHLNLICISTEKTIHTYGSILKKYILKAADAHSKLSVGEVATLIVSLVDCGTCITMLKIHVDPLQKWVDLYRYPFCKNIAEY